MNKQEVLEAAGSTPSTAGRCEVCDKPATFMCSSCGASGPRYCSQECQTAGWAQGHYSVCVANATSPRSAGGYNVDGGEAATNSADASMRRSSSTTRRRKSQRTSMGRWNAAQLINARRRASTTDPTSPTSPNTTNPLPGIPLSNLGPSAALPSGRGLDAEAAEELKFYMHQIYLVIQPVVLCIVLSILWVKIAFSGKSNYQPVRASYLVYSEPATGDATASQFLGSLTNAAIIISQIIVVTIIIVCLFKHGFIKILIGFFMIVVLGLLGFMGYLLLLNLIEVFVIPLDYPTMIFALWNFSVVGLSSVFWKGPLWLQQSYLTVMSSLMAFSLTGLEQWTTWMLLGLLAIWDLIAVLCPFGPLRILVESSRTQQQEVPALLYSVNAVWFMATPPGTFRLSPSLHRTMTAPCPGPESMLGAGSGSGTRTPSPPNPALTIDTSSAFATAQAHDRWSHGNLPATDGHGMVIVESDRTVANGFVRLREGSEGSVLTAQRTEAGAGAGEAMAMETIGTRNPGTAEEEEDEEDEERSGLKLGLGDFVFYSVLIARAAMYDWITTVCCTIAVLTGLTATIFLLAIAKKALPALPISIAFGMLFYFVAKTVLVPFVAQVGVLGMVGL